MSNKLKPYSEYQESGEPWLGIIPSHWDMERAKRLFQRMQRPVRPEDETITCFRDGIVTLRRNRRTEGFTESLKEIGYQGVRKGDLVIHAMDAFAGAVGVSDSEGKSTPVYSVCQPIGGANPHYYAYIVREMARSGYILALARGIRERSSDFRYSTFAVQYLPVPPGDEQNTIAAFVKTVKHLTRCYIRAKQRLIELLEEQKQALIQRAVTCGLDPDVPLKDSGIEWLGKIPEHWAVRKLKHIAKVELSGVDKHSYEDEIPVHLCNYTDVYNNDLISDAIDFMPATATESEIETFTLQKGDVIITKDSETWEDIAVPAVVKQQLSGVLCGYHLALIRPDRSQILGDYLFRAFSTPVFAYQFIINATGIMRYGISKDAITSSLFIQPPIEEQRAICQFIDAHLQPIAKSIEDAKRQIKLVKEYRTRLIADVVTGKLDVRKVKCEGGRVKGEGRRRKK